jgi:hypothetical protein
MSIHLQDAPNYTPLHPKRSHPKNLKKHLTPISILMSASYSHRGTTVAPTQDISLSTDEETMGVEQGQSVGKANVLYRVSGDGYLLDYYRSVLHVYDAISCGVYTFWSAL